MLLQSQLDYVQFLPALPEEWATGFVKGIVARGNFVINMKWRDGQAECFEVTSRNGGSFVCEYENLSQFEVSDSKGNAVATETLTKDKISFQTQKAESYTIRRSYHKN